MIGPRLRKVCAEQGLTGAELGRRAKIKQSVVARVMTGRLKSFSREAAPRVYKALKGAIPLLDLLGVEAPEP